MRRGKRVNYNRVVVFIVIALVFAAVGVKVSFFYTSVCDSFECFQENMKLCNKAIYLNDDVEATWRYEILGVNDDGECDVETTLLQPKQGELGIDELAGLSMTCSFPKGVVTYPEKFLDRCHGRLKEEFQNIVIEKLHTYLIEQIGEIDESLELLLR